jgi:hypothetical protein
MYRITIEIVQKVVRFRSELLKFQHKTPVTAVKPAVQFQKVLPVPRSTFLAIIGVKPVGS